MDTDRIEIELPPIFLNQSRFKSYQDCKRYYGWLHEEGIISARPRKQLVTGTAIHRAQVQIHDGGGTEEVIKKATDDAAAFFTKEMTPEGPQIALGESSEAHSKDTVDGAATIKRMLPAYHRHYAELGQQWKPLGQELQFCVEVGEGTNVWVVGTIDNLAIFMQGLWIVDYKTMTSLNMNAFLKYQTDLQLTAYIYGGSKQLTQDAKKKGKAAVRIRGAIIDGMVKTIVPQFHREIYTRSVEELREFELEFCFTAWEIAASHAMVKGDRTSYNLFRDKMYDLGSTSWKVAFPKSTNHCFQYGKCTHHDLCVKDNETRRLSFVKRTPDYVDRARTGSGTLTRATEDRIDNESV